MSGTIYFRGPVGSMEGPRLVSDPMGVSSCVLRVPWYGFCCLGCKNIAFLWPRLVRVNTPAKQTINGMLSWSWLALLCSGICFYLKCNYSVWSVSTCQHCADQFIRDIILTKENRKITFCQNPSSTQNNLNYRWGLLWNDFARLTPPHPPPHRNFNPYLKW